MQNEDSKSFGLTPHKLVSWWEMIEFIPYDFLTCLNELAAFESLCYQKNQADPLSRGLARTLLVLLGSMEKHLKKCELVKSIAIFDMLFYPMRAAESIAGNDIQGVPTPSNHDSYQTVAKQLRFLQLTIHTELADHKFAYIPMQLTQYFEKDDLFGQAVKVAFPSAALDIKEAGNCIAADLNTAAVFHLMRAAERGMRALVIHLKVKIEKPKGSKFSAQLQSTPASMPRMKQIPLEYALWDDVLKALEVRVKKIQTPKGSKRDKQYEFYHGLILSLNAFKDIWRNPVSHCRCTFDNHQAQHAFVHVKSLMENLATKLKERV